ncbi:MAG: LLM class F420-dependent oxidoreductase [Proteobacteria bacterium]|nr:LLM class F420-dependent oxidoreductase [Pseudomonadota bacterium]
MNLGKLSLTLPAPFCSAAECIELARRAESEWGYEAIWLAETNGAESFALAGAISQATERVEIGTAIVPAYNRTPAVLAMGTGTLAQLSGQRFILGVGSSSHAIIRHWNGMAFEAPLTRVRETVAVLRQALAGEKTEFHGETLHSDGFRLGALPSGPQRIYLAALREKMLQLAGEIGDGLIINFFPLESVPKILGAYREGAGRVGRDAADDEVVARFQVCVTDDVASARNLVRLSFGGYVAAPVYNKFFRWVGYEDVARNVAEAFDRRDRAATGAAMTDSFIDSIAILGSAEACREQLAAFVEAGITTPVVSPLATSADEARRMCEALAPANT